MRLTLRTKAAIVSTAAVLCLVALAGWWQYRALSAEYLTLLREQQQALSESTAADLDYKLGMHLAVLSRVASQADARTFRDPQARQRFLADSGLRSMFDAIALVDVNGEAFAHEPLTERPFTIADRDHFKRARETGRPTISEPARVSPVQLPAVLMLAPVKAADGQVVGFVAASLDLQRPNVLGKLRQAKAGHAGHYVIETTGSTPVIVMHPDASQLLQPASQLGLKPGDVVTRAPIRIADWTLRTVVPAAAADAPLQQARRTLLWQLLAVAFGSALLAWLTIGWVMQPLQTLLANIRALRRSPDTALELDLRSSDERGELAREFDALMSELREQRAQLAAVMDASPLGLFRCDSEGRIVYVNDAYLQVHGLKREDAATGWLSLVREDLRESAWAAWQRVVHQGESLHTTRTLHRADGSTAQVSVRSRPVWANGRLAGQVGTVADITERIAAERAQRTLTAIFDATTDYVMQADPQGRMTYMNPAARRRVGLAPDADVGQLTVADLNPPETIDRLRNEIIPKASAEGVWVGESIVWDAARRPFPVSHIVIAHRNREGKVEYFSALMRDISAARQTQLALKESEARLRTVADTLPMRVAYVDAQERYRFNNLAYERGFGRPREELYGKTVRELLGDSAYAAVEPHIRKVLAGEAVTFQSEMTNGDSYVCYEAQYVPQPAEDGSGVIGFHAIVTDITRQKLEERRLLQLAQVDPLTGLANRAGFDQHLGQAMSRARSSGMAMALMYLDIDRFKQVNDQHGHLIGDALLREFAQRLQHVLRATDVISRLGGDEFTVVMENLPRTEVAATVASKIVAAMRAPFELDGHTSAVTTSIGLAFYQGGTTPARELVKQADEMLYQAKGAGRDRFHMPLTLVQGGR